MQNDIQNQANLLQHGFVSTVLNASGGIFNNGKVAIAKDLIFGLSVWTETGWTPLTEGSYEELIMVRSLIDNSPSFLWHDEFNNVVKAAIERESKDVQRD